MRRYSLTELSNKSGEIVEAAIKGPIEITKRGKRKFVLLSAEDYDHLRRIADPRRVYATGRTPPDIAELFLPELERLARGDESDSS